MLFNSVVFLFAFLPIAYLVYWRLHGRNSRYGWLVATGYVFYGYWRWTFCLLMAFSTLVSFTAGLGLVRARTPWARRLCLIVPVTVDLSLLGYFKYADFAIGSMNAVAGTHFLLLHILLPIGISFYTFHTISYIVDCYRGVIQPTRNLLEFAAYVSLFSQLVAGPIIRFSELQADLENIDHKERRAYVNHGWSFFALGMIQKVLIADTIASHIDPAIAGIDALSTGAAWMCALGYSYQLLLDFAGYSNMAVGLGLLFGMHIPQNFNCPYQALSPSDFWRRWHISLSRCLRDYLYIPLGGNRAGTPAMYRNLLITMLLGGLWHGANWTFVLWGAYHGVLLILYRLGGRAWDRLPPALQRAGMFLLVSLGWVVFRAPSFHVASVWLQRMFSLTHGITLAGAVPLAIVLAIAAVITHAGPSSFELSHEWSWPVAIGIALLFVLCVLRIFGDESSPFLYFQF